MKMKSDELEEIIFEATESVLAEQGLGSRLKSAWSAFKGDKDKKAEEPKGYGPGAKPIGPSKKAREKEPQDDVTKTGAGQQIYNAVYGAVQQDFLKIKDYVDRENVRLAGQLKKYIQSQTGTGLDVPTETPPEGEKQPAQRKRVGFVEESLIKAVHEALGKIQEE